MTVINAYIADQPLNDTYKLVEQRGSIYVFDVCEGTMEYNELMGELKDDNR